jgi:uncharacterized membrane protein
MKSLQNFLRVYWLSLLFVALNIALLLILYGQLPDPVPMLWSSDGDVISWMAKPMGALLLPLAQLLVTLFLIIAPMVDPKAWHAPAAPRFYPLAVAIISGFLMLVTGLIFAASLGAELNVAHSMLGGLGVLVALIGNYLGKLPKNHMVGIRTPWTLSSRYVWERTHRFAAPVFVTGGLALFAYSFLQGDSFSSFIAGAIIVVIALAPYCYSYLIWKKNDSEKEHA